MTNVKVGLRVVVCFVSDPYYSYTYSPFDPPTARNKRYAFDIGLLQYTVFWWSEVQCPFGGGQAAVTGGGRA
jgi:hypothetical protein